MPEAPLRCPQCAVELPALARFCSQCGARVVAAAPVVAAPAASPPGERRPVAILFADLSGYTRLSSALDPEETHRLLTRFFELTDGVIERFGGAIDKHIGDAVMAVFGAPIAYGNDVERALRAAVEIHAAMAVLSAEFGRPLATHVGIASGEVVAATTGSAAHRTYTVTGDAVNLAARLTDLAAHGETVVSEDVQQSIGALAETEPLGSVEIRGLAGGTRAWKVLGLRSPSRVDQPLLGRDDERRRFAALVARARDARHGAVALLCADPGMGKTRLAEMLLRDAAAAGAVCHSATVLDFGAGQGRDAIYALVCSLLAVPADESAAARRRALDEAIRAGRADAADEPYLADLLMTAQRPGSLYDAMDNEAHQQGKRRAVARSVGRAAAGRPCVLLVDDVHWASPWVLDCLREVAIVAKDNRVVLALTTRRDGDPVSGKWPAGDVTRFDLAPLNETDALALAHAHLASAPDLARRCVDRAQGNPLFLTQLLRSDTDESVVPPTIQSVVLARLDRLAPRDKAAVQAAAVIGQRFGLELLRHLVGDASYDPAVPVERDLVRRDGARAHTLMFTHALIRDGAYASLLHSTRRELHRAAAHWYETRDPTLRAEHLDRADDPRAAEAYLAAARAEHALRRIDAALGLVARGRGLQAPAPIRYELAALEGALQLELGHPTASIAAFERAREAALDDAQRCAAWIGIASGHRVRSAVTAGLAALDVAEPLAVQCGLLRERSRIAYLRGSLHFARGDPEACRLQHERALELAQQAGDAEGEAQALSGLADALYAQGRMHTARAAFARCIEICDRRGYTRFAIMNHCMLAIIDSLFGRYGDALARLEQARATARDVQHRFAEVMADESAAWLLVSAGRYAEAGDALERGLALARTVGARRLETILQVSRARIEWHEGRRDDARRRLDEAWALSEKVGPNFAGPIVLGVRARVAPTPDERRRALTDGERLLQQGCVSHCYYGFYQDAIDVALESHAWAEAERYAALLEDYQRPEPLPLVGLYVDCGRALAAAGRGHPDRAALESCRRRSLDWGVQRPLAALDAALARAR
jgi:class 3 adenylate cyclase/tetratricopeptide (TPR) repeat protein